MSDARHQRFEIDIDEIERQLRRSVEAAPAPKPDPLAELARIVGQDDPFRGILGGGKATARSSDPTDDLRRDLDGPAGREDASYDPVADAYGSPDAAYAAEDLQPLRPRRSRSRLFAVVGCLLLAVGATAGVLVWRNGGAQFSLGGPPPTISADKTPLKVAPENPGGIDVPNQDRQVYERGATEGQSRVVDSREQPVDVREAVRALPPAAPAPADAAAMARSGGNPANGAATTSGRSAATGILGEPKRVRTVAVRPDGSTYAPNGAASGPTLPELGPGIAPGVSFPPPVPVTTMSIPAGSAPSAPAGASAAAPPASPQAGPPPVTVLPPQRPRFDRGTDATPAAAPASDSRFASTSSTTPAPAVEPAPAPAVEPAPVVKKRYAVQIAVRPSEEEARNAYAELSGKFGAALSGKPTSFAKAEVAGKTVYRVRVGPLSKDAADSLCTRLKASGGPCFVAAI